MPANSRLHPYLTALITAATIVAIFVSFAAPLLPARASAQAQPAAPGVGQAQQLLLPARQDATIVERLPNQNFGSAPRLEVGREQVNTGLISDSDALLQWDLGVFPPGTSIDSAAIGLFQTAAGAGPVLIYQVFAPWDAAEVTWATQPGAEIVDRTWSPANSGQYEFHASAALQQLVSLWVNAAGNPPNHGLLLRYGGSGFSTHVFDSREAPSLNPPLLRVDYTLPPIRVCLDRIDPCIPAAGAQVYERKSGRTLAAGADGRIDAAAVALGDQLWARLPANDDYPQAQLFHTTAGVTPVAANQYGSFGDSNGAELRLLVRSDRPLLLYDLNVSAQWVVEDDPSFADQLRRNVMRASDYLYAFTNGQFALGQVTVRQAYEGWEAADIKLHTSNVLHPNATIGGIVPAATPDISPAVPITYTPGSVFMGSYWNRFGAPPNQEVTYKGAVVPPEQLADDWSIALAHELAHYLLFLFDTYTDPNGVSSEALAAQCAGSAMGDTYLPANQAFIFDQALWDANCGATEAHTRLNGRTEWATIRAWYSFAVAPSAPGPGGFPPVPLTNVTFLTPPVTAAPLAGQVFTLTYELNQTSSGEARAFLLRDDSLIFEQGKPPEGATSIQLVDARVGDRLCVFDLNDHAEAPDAPRHQFGCETIAPGDSVLAMTNDPAWNPTVTIAQTGPQQLSVSVQQPLASGLALQARLIPETSPGGPAQALSRSGDMWTTVFDLPGPVAPVYLQLWVDESPAAPQTRREVIADRGTGGNGAYGPARHHGGVLAVSSDGNAGYQPDAPLELQPGQSVAWQSMPGTPPVPPWKRISGQSYRLDAFPASLVSSGQVSIQFEDAFGVLQAAGAASPAAPAAVAQLHFWDGQAWRPLPTTLGTPANAEDGVRLATAPSQGVGVYAVMIDSKPNLFLPSVRR